MTLFCFSIQLRAQNGGTLLLKVISEQQAPLPHSTVELLQGKDSALLKISMTDTAGIVRFTDLAAGNYQLRISRVDYASQTTSFFSLSSGATLQLPTLTLKAADRTLANVTVAVRKPFVEQRPDKTIINLEAGITYVGTTALEALEKLPGISVDKDGNISLKGKSGVLVLIDGKQTYLDPAQLATMLGGMSAAQLSQVEIMDQPSARYDAAGNAGIINIKTKRTRQKGLNGSISTAYSQGAYYKNNNSLQLNYRNGKFSTYVNYSLNSAENFTRIDALRRYFDKDESSVLRLLEQPSFLKGKGRNNNLRLGADYSISDKTMLGLNLNGFVSNRSTRGSNTARWMDASYTTDSIIQTRSYGNGQFKNGGANLNMRHQFSATRTLSADVDVLGYRIISSPLFENNLVYPGTYSEATRATIPSDINIVSAKADYSQQLQATLLEGGWKTSHITTDNLADYQYLEGRDWKPDYGKTNHFRYREDIHAAYVHTQTNLNRWDMQAGLRYEWTCYKGTQLGNAVRKDSSFSRTYNSLFPSLLLTYAADSGNHFSFSAGRRIDRPAFQKLNPFLFIINKYTYQQGNPFFRPQYTWNMELSHQYKDILTTGISYSTTKDYFSQIFPVDTGGIVIYTEDNLSRMQNFGVQVGVQLTPLKWWSFNAQAVVNRKKIEGVLWKDYSTSITQMTVNMAHQFRLQRGWAGELSGVYTSRSQEDLQEVVDPAGQLSAGVSKSVFKNKATVKLAMRDLFYTQWMKGLTHFEQANESFKLTRDTRVATLSLNWRFGKAVKGAKRSAGAAGEEMQRVGAGN